VPAVLRRYRAAYPQIALHVDEGGSQDLVAGLLTHGLDLALIVAPEHGVDPALHVVPLLRESLVVASAVGAPPAATGRLNLTDLRDVPMVMFRVGYDLRDATLAACERAGFTPRYAVEGGEMDAVLAFVEAGLGVALVPSMVLANRPRLRATPVAGPGVHRIIALAHRRESVLPHAAQAMRATLLKLLDEGSTEPHATSLR
jgi:DNA-binding transcriptional LysR family regulator